MTLHGVLETAVQDGIIPSNVAHFKTAANANQRKAKGEKQARIRAKVLRASSYCSSCRVPTNTRHSFFGLFFLLARTGLRIGEAVALQIGHVDFVKRLINVERNLVKGEIGLPKSGLTRQVDMSKQLARVLGKIVLDRKEQLLRLGLSIDDLPHLWLFQNELGKPLDDSKVRKIFTRLLPKQVLRKEVYISATRHRSFRKGESFVYLKDR